MRQRACEGDDRQSDEAVHADDIQRHEPEYSRQMNAIPTARIAVTHGGRAWNDRSHRDVARNRRLPRTLPACKNEARSRERSNARPG